MWLWWHSLLIMWYIISCVHGGGLSSSAAAGAVPPTTSSIARQAQHAPFLTRNFTYLARIEVTTTSSNVTLASLPVTLPDCPATPGEYLSACAPTLRAIYLPASSCGELRPVRGGGGSRVQTGPFGRPSRPDPCHLSDRTVARTHLGSGCRDVPDTYRIYLHRYGYSVPCESSHQIPGQGRESNPRLVL